MGLFDIFKKKPIPPNVYPMTQDTNLRVHRLPTRAELVQIEQLHDSMCESLTLINTTVYPKTYFHRYNLAIQQAEVLLTRYGRHKYNGVAAQTLQFLHSGKPALTNSFFDRCDKAGKLPFIRNDLLAVRSEIPDESFAYFETLFSRYANNESRKEYVFYSVIFNENGKPYYYLSDDDNIRCGDYVTVPIGEQSQEVIGRVVKIETFKGADAPIPIDRMKRILAVQKQHHFSGFSAAVLMIGKQ